MNINELRGWLKEGVVDITFTKKDGSERQGFFTTREDLVAETSGNGGREHADDMLVVTEMVDGNAQWRSFHFDQVTSVGVQ
ncbi:MAG: DUF2693 domain-containing protein [Candidatus Marinimicrobia bacterium]|jgi:hypothetical protein|nr:DUF2693 domain-containing protein [Candidatus Neomarinimicrobiota bacterium]